MTENQTCLKSASILEKKHISVSREDGKDHNNNHSSVEKVDTTDIEEEEEAPSTINQSTTIRIEDLSSQDDMLALNKEDASSINISAATKVDGSAQEDAVPTTSTDNNTENTNSSSNDDNTTVPRATEPDNSSSPKDAVAVTDTSSKSPATATTIVNTTVETSKEAEAKDAAAPAAAVAAAAVVPPLAPVKKTASIVETFPVSPIEPAMKPPFSGKNMPSLALGGGRSPTGGAGRIISRSPSPDANGYSVVVSVDPKTGQEVVSRVRRNDPYAVRVTPNPAGGSPIASHPIQAAGISPRDGLYATGASSQQGPYSVPTAQQRMSPMEWSGSFASAMDGGNSDINSPLTIQRPMPIHPSESNLGDFAMGGGGPSGAYYGGDGTMPGMHYGGHGMEDGQGGDLAAAIAAATGSSPPAADGGLNPSPVPLTYAPHGGAVNSSFLPRNSSLPNVSAYGQQEGGGSSSNGTNVGAMEWKGSPSSRPGAAAATAAAAAAASQGTSPDQYPLSMFSGASVECVMASARPRGYHKPGHFRDGTYGYIPPTHPGLATNSPPNPHDSIAQGDSVIPAPSNNASGQVTGRRLPPQPANAKTESPSTNPAMNVSACSSATTGTGAGAPPTSRPTPPTMRPPATASAAATNLSAHNTSVSTAGGTMDGQRTPTHAPIPVQSHADTPASQPQSSCAATPAVSHKNGGGVVYHNGRPIPADFLNASSASSAQGSRAAHNSNVMNSSSASAASAGMSHNMSAASINHQQPTPTRFHGAPAPLPPILPTHDMRQPMASMAREAATAAASSIISPCAIQDSSMIERASNLDCSDHAVSECSSSAAGATSLLKGVLKLNQPSPPACSSSTNNKHNNDGAELAASAPATDTATAADAVTAAATATPTATAPTARGGIRKNGSERELTGTVGGIIKKSASSTAVDSTTKPSSLPSSSKKATNDSEVSKSPVSSVAAALAQSSSKQDVSALAKKSSPSGKENKEHAAAAAAAASAASSPSLSADAAAAAPAAASASDDEAYLSGPWLAFVSFRQKRKGVYYIADAARCFSEMRVTRKTAVGAHVIVEGDRGVDLGVVTVVAPLPTKGERVNEMFILRSAIDFEKECVFSALTADATEETKETTADEVDGGNKDEAKAASALTAARIAAAAKMASSPLHRPGALVPRVVRAGTCGEIEEDELLEYEESEAAVFAHSQAKKILGPGTISIHYAVFQFDRQKLTLYYSTESGERVYFVQLLKTLNQRYHCRIWMELLAPGDIPPPKADADGARGGADANSDADSDGDADDGEKTVDATTGAEQQQSEREQQHQTASSSSARRGGDREREGSSYYSSSRSHHHHHHSSSNHHHRGAGGDHQDHHHHRTSERRNRGNGGGGGSSAEYSQGGGGGGREHHHRRHGGGGGGGERDGERRHHRRTERSERGGGGAGESSGHHHRRSGYANASGSSKSRQY